MKLPIGISDFSALKSGGYALVDKSLLIKDLLDEGTQVVLFTRPRRFGKTLNMSMLYYYFSLDYDWTHELFSDLGIWQQGTIYQQHQGKYPVIFLTLKGIKYNSYQQSYEKIKSIVADLYRNYRFLLTSDVLTADEKVTFEKIIQQNASEVVTELTLRNLTIYLHKYYKIKPILLIDEYDQPIHASFSNGYYMEMIDFMQHFLGEALKDNTHLYKGVISGILRISKESIFSGLNNLKVYTALSGRYAQYFGFLENETESLLNSAGANKAIISQVKDWYNGYQFEDTTIYNPWSILNFIVDDFKFQAFWVNTSDNQLIDQLLLDSASINQAQFEKLLQFNPSNQVIENDVVFADVKKRPNTLWTFLLHTGYLTVHNVTQDLAGFFHGDFIIPNKEVALLFRTLIIRWFSTEHTPTTNLITQALIQGDVETFKRLLAKFAIESFSYFDAEGKPPEKIYHMFVLGLVAHLSDYYCINSNRESGDGRYDVALIPKDKTRTGIIFEFKSLKKGASEHVLRKEAQKALDQIKNKQYIADFYQAEIKMLLQLGLAFSGKHFELLTDKIDI